MNEVKLPDGFIKIAEVIGVGRDKHLSVILAYAPADKEFVTWIANKSCNPRFGSNCGEGHYFRYEEGVSARRDFENFYERAAPFVNRVPSFLNGDVPTLS